MTIAYRPAELRDRDFVIGAWETSYRMANTSGMISFATWPEVMRAEIAAVLDRPHVQTIVAHNPDDPDHVADLHGFITAEPDDTPALVYYVFVKLPYRRMGIARRLFEAVGINPERRFVYVCSTPIVPKLARSIPAAKWDPVRGRLSRDSRRAFR